MRFGQTAASRVNLEPLVTDLLNGSVLHTDETPVRTTERIGLYQEAAEKAKRITLNACIHTYSNATTTLLTANAYKDDESVSGSYPICCSCATMMRRSSTTKPSVT